ncbi:MAG: STAS domain-containing protein [Acidobacteriota bacterium]
MSQQLEVSYLPEAVENTAVLHLRGTASYRQAPELRSSLFEAIQSLDSGRRLVVELAEVEQIDTAGMAVLVEGLLATRDQGPDLYFCTPSDSVRKVFRLAGLEEALQRCYGCLGDVPERAAAAG